MIRKFLLVIIGVSLILTAVFVNHHKTKTVTTISPPPRPCTVDPCIRIIQSDGTAYNLNDFRFVSPTVDPRHCILFVSLPDRGHRETCQPYKLLWIGPDNIDQKHNTEITT